MSKLGARPLTEPEWAMLDHMVRTGGWTPDDSQPFEDPGECRALAVALGHRGFCLLDGGRGVHPETWGALISPKGIAYHRWNRPPTRTRMQPNRAQRRQTKQRIR